METFHLVAKITVSAYTTVQAETLEDAIKRVEGRPAEPSGHGNSRRHCWIVYGIDSTPYEVEADTNV